MSPEWSGGDRGCEAGGFVVLIKETQPYPETLTTYDIYFKPQFSGFDVDVLYIWTAFPNRFHVDGGRKANQGTAFIPPLAPTLSSSLQQGIRPDNKSGAVILEVGRVVVWRCA